MSNFKYILRDVQKIRKNLYENTNIINNFKCYKKNILNMLLIYLLLSLKVYTDTNNKR